MVRFQVLRNKPDFRRKPWPSISGSGKDFVKKLLVKDPRARLTAAQALCMLLHLDPSRIIGYAAHVRCGMDFDYYKKKKIIILWGFLIISPLYLPSCHSFGS